MTNKRDQTELFQKRQLDLGPQRYYFPFPTKLVIFFAARSGYVVVGVFLMINKDLA
ncbi:MAG: hypothetical protein KJ950_15320 [Proteobacteria bacterium]|nr:hypothetical protein [Pseudomonadota bacterium]MBU1686895.1 hypothetical protein [Pseudomonadota bacterium]